MTTAFSLHVDPHGEDPPYEQVRQQIAAAAARGDLPAGTRLATVRGLAEELGLAANTVAKAYRVLEGDGVIETRGRSGTFVRGSSHSEAAARAAAGAARTYATEARRLGLTRTQAQRLVDEHWT